MTWRVGDLVWLRVGGARIAATVVSSRPLEVAYADTLTGSRVRKIVRADALSSRPWGET